MGFSGLAIYEPGVFAEMAEDVAPVISIIAPHETPLLDLLGDPPYPAQQIYHEWQEDTLQPDTIISSCAVASVAGGDSAISIAGGLAQFLRVGTLLQMADAWNGEIVQVSVIAGNTITVTRAFGASVTSAYPAGQPIKVLSDVSLEGDEVTQDNSTARARLGNYVEPFKEDIIISGTAMAVKMLNVQNEMEYQKQQKIRTVLKNLEKSVIRSILSGNTIGGSSLATGYRTMNGLIASIKTNVTSIAVNSFTTDAVNAAVALAWGQGATDLDVMVCDQIMKLNFDALAASRIRQLPEETVMRTLITYYESSYGIQHINLNRWMPPGCFIGLATPRCKVLPLRGRSFAYIPVAKTGDSEKGMVVGEYTLELKNEYGHLFVHQ